MNSDPNNPPSEWGGFVEGVKPWRLPDSPDPGVYVTADNPWGEDDPIGKIIFWHWHEPAVGNVGWLGSAVTQHTLVSLNPLHLEPSLGCFASCPSHGWIRDGRWVNAA